MAIVTGITKTAALAIKNAAVVGVKYADSLLSFTNFGGTVAGTGTYNGAPGLVTLSAYDIPSADFLVPDWYQLGTPNVRLSEPASPPPSASTRVTYSSDGRYMALAHLGAGFIAWYRRKGDQYVRLTDPTSPGSSSSDIAWSPDGRYLACVSTGSSTVRIYKRSGDSLTLLATPITPAPGSAASVDWSPDSLYLTIGLNSAPFMSTYSRAGDIFNIVTAPASMPTGSVYALKYSPDGKYLAIRQNATPNLKLYKTGAGGVLAALSTPASQPTQAQLSDGLSWSPDSRYLSITYTAAPYVWNYKKTAVDVFTTLTPAFPTPTAGAIKRAVFSPDGRYLVANLDVSPFTLWYKFASDTFTLLTGPALTSRSNSQSAFSPDGLHLAICGGTSNVDIYKSALGYIDSSPVKAL